MKQNPKMKRGPYELHGMSHSRAYSAWKNMKGRCLGYQKKQKRDYAGRGITFCKRWQSFEAFLKDMGEPPDRMTLDRKNNEGNYTPRNCRWATRSQQQLNQRPIRANNKSGHKGVCFDTRAGKWLVTFRGRRGGHFIDINKAIAKRKEMERSHV